MPTKKAVIDSITTWVDRLTRLVHFIPSRGMDTVVDLVQEFFCYIFKYHGLPDTIVSDLDPKFTFQFWSQLLKLCGVGKHMSSTHHPYTYGASEIMNRLLENYLSLYCSLRQNDSYDLLPAAEFAYHSAISDELKSSPFEIYLRCQSRLPLVLSSPPSSSVEIAN